MIHAKFRPFFSVKLVIASFSAIIFITLSKYAYNMNELHGLLVKQQLQNTHIDWMNRTFVYSNISCEQQMSRKDICNNCSWHGFNYIVQSDHICHQGNEVAIEILFIILTQHSRKLQRAVIRRTWASGARHNKGKIRYVFLLGISSSERENMETVKESKIYGDILVEDFIDSYENLTLKTIMGFKWASQKCSKANLVLKVDDDMWVNIPALYEVSSAFQKKLQNSVGGSCFQNVEPDRNCLSKWYVSEDLYPHERYPDFCSGTAYITSLNMAKKIYEISKNVPYFYLEDVYVGLCVKMLGYNVTTIPGFYHRNVTKGENLCDYKKMDIVTVHNVSPLKIETLWNINCEGKNAYIADFFKTNTSEISQEDLKIEKFPAERY